MEKLETYLRQIKDYDPEFFGAIDSLIENFESAPTLKEMTVAEYESFNDAVRAMWDQSRKVEEITLGAEKAAIEDIVAEVELQAADIAQTKSPLWGKALANSGVLGKGLLQFDAARRLVSEWVRAWDYKTPGILTKAFVETPKDQVSKYIDRQGVEFKKTRRLSDQASKHIQRREDCGSRDRPHVREYS